MRSHAKTERLNPITLTELLIDISQNVQQTQMEQPSVARVNLSLLLCKFCM